MLTIITTIITTISSLQISAPRLTILSSAHKNTHQRINAMKVKEIPLKLPKEKMTTCPVFLL